MTIKLLFTVLLLMLFKDSAYSQTTAALTIPAGWTTEKFALPPAFAPGIPFKGSEEIAFAPGWSQKNAEDYWTYCYLWKIKSGPAVNKTTLELALKTYYTRLVITNLTLANIDSAYAIPVKVSIHQLANNNRVYEGKINMLDYMTQNPISLYIRIKIKAADLIFFQLSPLPYTNSYWAVMNKMAN